MAYEHKENTFTLFEFKPKDRARTDRDPVLVGKGAVKLEGMETAELRDFSLFKSESKDGNTKYFTVYIKEPFVKNEDSSKPSSSSDVPF